MKRLVILWAMVSVLIAAGLFWRLEIIEVMVGADRPFGTRQDGGELYQRLVDLGLISKDGDTVVLPPEDMELRQALAAGGKQVPDTERHKALSELYDSHSRQGMAVRRAVALWNGSRTIVAVRDDRLGPPDSNHGPILTGERPNQWDASDPRGRPLLPADILAPESFAYVNGRKVLPGFGDWKMFLGSREAILMSTPLALEKAATVSLQIIGRLDIAGSKMPANAVVLWRCPQGACTAENATAATVILPDVQIGETRLSVKLSAVPALALPVSGLPLAFGVDQVRLCRTGGLEACAGQIPRWISLPRTVRRHEGSMTILTADGVLLWQNNRPTEDAIRLGLLPVVGIDPRHSWSLVGQLARRQKEREKDVTLRLTIDSKVQEAAQTALDATIHDRFDGRDDDAPYRDRRRAALTVIDPDTGAVLATAQWPRVEPGVSAYDLGALAAGDPTRDPLASVGWAATSSDFAPGSAWKLIIDLAALKVANSNPAVAAMIYGCKPNADGSLPCAPGLNVSQQRYLIPGQACGKHGCGIQNFRSQSRGIETLHEALETPSRSPRCVGGVASRPTSVGMAEALKVSNNIWQVKLAELMDAASARIYDAQAKRRTAQNPDLTDLKNSAVTETATQLGLFEDDFDLLTPLSDTLDKAGLRNGLAIESAQSDLFDLTQPGTREDRPTGALDALAQTAIGQRVAVAPIHLARIAATARSGIVPVLHLAEALNGESLPAATGQAFPAKDLSPLRNGMKSVVESDGGTAAEAFGGADSGPMARKDDRSERLKNARCSIFGKTGSGQLPQKEDGRSLNSGWFVGWAEVEAFDALAAGSAPAWHRPVAFSCAISPVHGFIRRENGRVEWTKTGGSTCAPAIADFLLRLGASRND